MNSKLDHARVGLVVGQALAQEGERFPLPGELGGRYFLPTFWFHSHGVQRAKPTRLETIFAPVSDAMREYSRERIPT